MSEHAEQFRRKALELEQLADAVSDEGMANQFLDIAKQWRELADQVERHNLK